MNRDHRGEVERSGRHVGQVWDDRVCRIYLGNERGLGRVLVPLVWDRRTDVDGQGPFVGGYTAGGRLLQYPDRMLTPGCEAVRGFERNVEVTVPKRSTRNFERVSVVEVDSIWGVDHERVAVIDVDIPDTTDNNERFSLDSIRLKSNVSVHNKLNSHRLLLGRV